MRSRIVRALCLACCAVYCVACEGDADDANETSGVQDDSTDTSDDTSTTPGGFGGFNRDDDDNDDDDDEEPVDLPPAQPIDPVVTTQCGERTCRDVLVGDIVVPPCCPEDNSEACGLELQSVAEYWPVRAQCAQLGSPGAADSACPEVFFDDPVEPRSLAGCCMPSGQCGVSADFSTLLADFGCVQAATFLSQGADGESRSCTPPTLPEDAGAPHDAGTATDIPEPTDAGVAPDAGPVPQPATDASASLDASATPSDAGVQPRLDAQTQTPPADAGNEPEAPTDAGQ